MLRTLTALAACTLIAFAFLACGDDDGSPARSGTPSGAVITDAPETATPDGGSGDDDGDDDGKTPGPQTTDSASEPPATAPGETPTVPPPATQGTPAVQPPDEDAFLAQFQGQSIIQETCTFDPSTVLTDCGSFGLYAIDPPIVGQDISCALLIVEDTPRAVRCSSVEPQQVKTYEIQ